MKKPRGTQDLLPEMLIKWNYIEESFKKICKRYGFDEIRTPIFEHTSLFKRGVGESTDVVSKEMYSVFNLREYYQFIQNKHVENNLSHDVIDKFLADKNRLTLKPEGTAPVVRAFVENKLFANVQPTKLYYNTPCLRHERPQAGRYRQFHQLGIEMFGSDSPISDAEIITLAFEFLNDVGLKNIAIRINSVGCPKCRAKYNKMLLEYLEDKTDNMCDNCKNRVFKNPMRTLDCKNEQCQENIIDAPLMIDNVCDDCISHMEHVKAHLDILDISYMIDPKIVRGLDYYTRTAFEIVHKGLGAQNAICGGGRYNGLVEQLGGPKISGVGFGLGLERLIIALESEKVEFPKEYKPDLYIVSVDETCDKYVSKLVYNIRKMGLKVERDYLGKSVKAQMKYANKINARFTLVVGEDEIASGKYIVKNMETGQQNHVLLDEISELIRR